jgi:aldose 1-epimerase
VRQEREDGCRVFALQDAAARSQVWVAPSLGFNVYRFSVELGERSVAVIDPPPALDCLRQSPSGYGTPILFPFAGRIPGGRFTFRGRPYALELVDSEGNAIHGFVLNRPWAVTGSRASPDEGARLAGRIESTAFPALAGQYPSAFRLEVTYRLRAWTLAMEARAQNTGPEPLPVVFGWHPYLHAPMDHGSSVGGCVIEVPATRRWELVDGVATGRLEPIEEDLSGGVSLEGRAFDAVYTGLRPADGGSRAVLTDTRRSLAVSVEADPQFKNWVVYTPPEPAVCLEPWTAPPDAINLEERGIDAGLIVLEPGEARSWTVRLAVRRI